MKTNFNSLGYIVLLVASVFLVSSCNFGTSKTKSNTEIIKKDMVEEQVREFVYPLPTSFEVTQMLNEIEAAYIISLSNESINADKYFTEKSKAINLGIYGADLSYASTYNQNQEIVNYMEASRKLIMGLDMEAAVSPNLYQQIVEKQDNKDALVDIISDSFYDSYEYLNKNGRTEISALILSGSWTEALYIATHISEQTFNNKQMVEIILKQKEPLEKLMEILASHKDDKAIAETIEDLTPLSKDFAAIEIGAITQQQLESIVTGVFNIRNKFITPE